MKKPMTWDVRLVMTLGKEKVSLSRSVNLDLPVRTVLAEMSEVRNEVVKYVNTAHDSILGSAAESMAKRVSQEKRK